jgi:hypothetical protein
MELIINSLGKYNLDELAKRVEAGSDSDGQKAEPILIAKSNMILTRQINDSMRTLSLFIDSMNKEVKREIEGLNSEMGEMKKSIDGLANEITIASSASFKQAKSVSRYTLWLAIATIVLAIGTILPALITFYNIYKK